MEIPETKHGKHSKKSKKKLRTATVSGKKATAGKTTAGKATAGKATAGKATAGKTTVGKTTSGKRTEMSGLSELGRAALRRKKQKERQHWLKLIGIPVAVAVFYFGGALYFNQHFLPHTVINGVKCGGKTVEQVKRLLEKETDGYMLTLVERGETQETISGDAIELKVVIGDELGQIQQDQNNWGWIKSLFSGSQDMIQKAIQYDSSKLSQAVKSLNCMDESRMTFSTNATLSEYQSGTGYELIPETYGTWMDETTLYNQISLAVSALETTLNLEEAGCYEDPDFTSDSVIAQQMLDTANRYVNTTVTYTFGDESVVLDGDTISQWILVDDEMNVTLDSEKEAAWMEELAEDHDTKWKSKKLKTHSGRTVTIGGGNYGWRMDQETTLADLNGYLEAGEDYTGEPAYYQTAATYDYDGYDYGDTYVEVSISAQHMWYYVDGALYLESDFVSGNVAEGHDTPTGAYRIAYKARDQELTGQGYTSPVSYWMPFVDGCGFHDASWRSQFGGTIYLTNGSHGCLNMPTTNAALLYDKITAGTAVLIY